MIRAKATQHAKESTFARVHRAGIEQGPHARLAHQGAAEGDTLLIVESMKMEIPVAAPAAGVVQEIFVAEGEMVEDGMVIMQLG